MNSDQYTVASLEELKNNTLLLTIANEHLDDEIFLNKIGNNISRAVEVLKRDISSLKKEYPGKFVNDVDTDSILERIDQAAQRMLKPGREVMDNHASGALGSEMESYLTSIRKAVDDIRIMVLGSHAHQSGKGSAINILDSFKAVSQTAGRILFFGVKFLACIIVLLGVVFAYLFFTMEKDTVFLNEIASSQAVIKEKKIDVNSLEKEKQDLYGKRTAMKDDINEMSRVEKVAALEVEMKMKSIDDKINQLEAEITVQEKRLNDNQKALDEYRQKSFIRKLLKQ